MSDNSAFWTRRRAGVKAEAEADIAAQEAARDAEQQLAMAEKSDEEVLEELGLPDPETLSKGDDFTAFMAKAVPEHIRKRALRKLWRSNPVLACVDGLNDYDDDYLTGSFGNAPIKTSYRVGEGLLAHVLEVARQTEVATSDPAPQEDLDVADPEQDVTCDEEVADTSPEPIDIADKTADDIDPPKPRRMAFHFDGDSA